MKEFIIRVKWKLKILFKKYDLDKVIVKDNGRVIPLVYILLGAKESVRVENIGMCWALKCHILDQLKDSDFRDTLDDYFPEFNYDTAYISFGAWNVSNPRYEHWWSLSNKECRLEYFDYLIDLYK